MKRFWIGVSVLLVLWASGSFVAHCMERCHSPISNDLSRAAQAATEGDLQRAIDLAEQALAQWLRCRDLTAAFADHTVIEEMDAHFAEIRVYAAAGDTTAFAAVCAHLSELAKAASESHRPMWQNLL